MQPWLTRRASCLAHGSNTILDSRNSSCTWKRRGRSLRVAGPLDWRPRLRNWGAEEGGRGPRWRHVGAAVCSGSGADQSGAHFFVRLQARNLLLRGLECEWGGVARTGRGSAGWVPRGGGLAQLRTGLRGVSSQRPVSRGGKHSLFRAQAAQR